jgi:hypothetical protein
MFIVRSERESPRLFVHLIEHVRLRKLSLEVGRTGKDEPVAVGLVVGDEELRGDLGHLPYVVVTLLEAEAGEAERGLAAAPVLLGQVDGELVQDFPRVALERAEQRPVAVHDYEAELVVVREECVERLGVKLRPRKTTREFRTCE